MQGQAISREDATGRSPGAEHADRPSAPPHPAPRDPDEFAVIVAHDLKEPLGGIRAYCEILAEDYGDKFDAAGQRRLGALVELCDRLADSIEQTYKIQR